MSILDNPFTPGSAAHPSCFVGQAPGVINGFVARLQDFEQRRRSTLLMGVRGTGKSTILNEFQHRARELDWVVARKTLRPGLNNEPDLAQTFSGQARDASDELSDLEKAKRKLKAIRDNITIEAPGAEGTKFVFRLAGSEAEMTLEDAMQSSLGHIGELAQQKGRGALFIYDDAQYLFDRPDDEQFPLSALLGAFTAMQEAELPVALVLAGLPSVLRLLASAQQNAPRNFDQVLLEPLSLVRADGVSEAGQAVVDIAAEGGVELDGIKTALNCEEAAAEQLAADSGGYLAGIQVLGSGLVEKSLLDGTATVSQELYAAHRDELIERRDGELYRGELLRTNPEQRTLLYRGAELGEPFALEDVGEGIAQPEALLEELQELGVVYEPESDRYAMAYGSFGEFLRRQAEQS